MTRSFDGTPVDEDWLTRACAEALRSPTAGNSAGTSMAIVPHRDFGTFYELVTDEAWRGRSRRSDGLSRAGAAVIVTARPDAYAERYAEPDKGDDRLSSADRWPVPYWFVDAGMAIMSLLLLIEEAGLGAVIWGNFRDEDGVRHYAEIPDEDHIVAFILVGHPDGTDEKTSSQRRSIPTRASRVRVTGPSPVT